MTRCDSHILSFDLFSYSLGMQQGLANCGPTIAYGVARYGLGDTLFDAAKGPASHLDEFLVRWRQQLLSVLRDDPKGHIGHKCATLAASLPLAFPDPAVLAAYVRPLTNNNGSSVPAIESRQPNLTALVSICDHRFGWGVTTHSRFKGVIWEGAVLRGLCKVSLIVAAMTEPLMSDWLDEANWTNDTSAFMCTQNMPSRNATKTSKPSCPVSRRWTCIVFLTE
jgi:hypothetical protein